MAKFCQNCGSALDGAPKFCPNCGSPIAQVDSPKTPASPQNMAESIPAPQSSSRTNNSPQVPPQPQRNNLPPRPVAQRANSTQSQNYNSPPPIPANPPVSPGHSRYAQAPPGYGQGAYGGAAFPDAPYVPDQGLAAMFLRYDNRLNRKPYILRSLALFAVAVVGVMLAAAIRGTAGTVLGYLVNIVVFVPAVMLMIRRLHDLNRPAWWCIGTFIPVLNFALGCYTLFVAGTPGPNPYGPDPLQGQR